MSRIALIAVLLVLLAVTSQTRVITHADVNSMKYQHEELFAKRVLQLPLFKQLSSPSENVGGSSGVGCATCVVIVRIIENYAVYHGDDIQKAMDNLCNLVSAGALKTACHFFVAIYGKQLVELLAKKQNPDVVCREIHMCTRPECKLFRGTMDSHGVQSSPEEMHNRLSEMSHHFEKILRPKVDEWWKEIFKRLYDVFDTHIPAYDFDNDMFATTFVLRGAAWRGRDCDDNNNQTYPGRQADPRKPKVDNNCNGIYGVAPNGKSWEEELCNVTQHGVIILGDSACARFRIPPQWVQPEHMHKDIFKPAFTILENEMDWPHMGWVTGYMNDTTGLTSGPVDSFYLRQLARNRCIHRDYQSICVNGARSGAMKSIAKTTSRNQQLDNPAVVFYALIGNDVCNGHNTTERFTKPQEFYENVVATLEHLDTILPPNSHIVFIGLADGGLLYPYLHNLTHPLGITYSAVYDFLNCLEISPCWGWMNSNETVRRLTTEAAEVLSQQYTKIIAERKFKNFDMIYHDYPMDSIVKEYLEKGGKFIDLIEPMDGFHPSQMGNALSMKVFYEFAQRQHPHILGVVNPNNDRIIELFGNQGGY